MNQMLLCSMFRKKKDEESSIYRSSPLMNEPRISFPPALFCYNGKKKTLPGVPKH